MQQAQDLETNRNSTKLKLTFGQLLRGERWTLVYLQSRVPPFAQELASNLNRKESQIIYATALA